MPVPDAARLASELGFEHIDVDAGWDGELALPVGDRMAHPSPRPGCSVPAPPAAQGMWDRAVAAYRRTPGMRLEPWPGSIVDSVEKVKAMLEAVPGLRLLVDTGHVANWGEDPVELLPWADHVQLRQASTGVVQAPSPTEGAVAFAAVFRCLSELDYRGRLRIQHFGVAEHGLPLLAALRL